MGKEVEAAIVRCWKCNEPMEVVEGKTTKPVTLWMKMGQAVATAHADDCEFRGREMPDKEIGSSSDSDRPATSPASRRGSTTTPGNIPENRAANGEAPSSGWRFGLRKGYWG